LENFSTLVCSIIFICSG